MASAEMDDAPIYRFGVFELNARSRQLLRQGRLVAIQPKPFDLLLYLIRHRDRVVPRDELLAEVWRGVHVDDEAVRFTLHAARRAVDDDGNRQGVIRTVPRLGARFVAVVEPIATPRGGGMHERQAPSLEGARSPFLGRERLMAEVDVLLEHAARGEGRVLLLSGEAGIGKTRALEQVAELATQQGFRVFRGRCVESEGAPAFWPWVQILRAAVGADPPAGLLRALGEGAREVAWMVPELRPFVPELPQAPPMDARAARFLLFDSVSAFLEELTSDVPHVVSIDDLHRADVASAALFHHVARELGHPAALRLLLVGTYREGELRATPAIAEPITAVTTLPHSRHEPLRGLVRDDVSTLVEMLSGHLPSKAVVADLHQKTNGNPFFLNQILRVLDSERRLAELESAESLDLELPGHVQDAIRRQLRLLPDDARELIELASVIGGDFSVTEIEFAAELERPLVLSRLGHAMEAGVIGERAGDPGRHRFIHALVRDAIYAGLPLDVRASHHARVARALEQRNPDQPSAESASIAHHYSQSSRRDDVARSVHFYEMAASWSSARGAFEAAPAYLDRALALLDDTQPSARADRCRLLLELGDALTNAGERDRAREVLQASAEIAQHQGLREQMASAALRFAPDFLAIETGVYDPDLVQLLERAIATLGESAAPVRAKLLARLAIALQWHRGQELRIKALCDEAVAIASRSEDPEARQYVQTVESLLNFSLVHPERQLQLVPNQSGSNSSLELLQGLSRVTSLLILGRIIEADEEILRFAELVERSRHPQSRWYVDLMRATRAQMEGRYEQAAHLASSFLALGKKYGDRNAVHSFEAQRVMQAFDFGGIESYEPRVRAMVEAFPRMVAWRAGLALVLIELNRIEEARSQLHRVIAAGPVASLPPSEWYVTAATLALACGALGESTLAARLYADLLPHADQFVVFGYCTYCLGSTQRLLAALASGMGRWDAAKSHFEAAIARNSAIGALACNAPIYFEYARMLRAAGRESDAITWSRRAAKVALQFGMVRLAEKSRDLARPTHS